MSDQVTTNIKHRNQILT